MRHIVVGIACHQSHLQAEFGGTRSMRFAALCVAACFVTGASVTLSESPALAVPDAAVAAINSASDVAPVESSDPSAAQPLESNEPLDHGLTSPERPRPALSRTELCGTAVLVAQANHLP